MVDQERRRLRTWSTKNVVDQERGINNVVDKERRGQRTWWVKIVMDRERGGSRTWWIKNVVDQERGGRDGDRSVLRDALQRPVHNELLQRQVERVTRLSSSHPSRSHLQADQALDRTTGQFRCLRRARFLRHDAMLGLALW